MEKSRFYLANKGLRTRLIGMANKLVWLWSLLELSINDGKPKIRKPKCATKLSYRPIKSVVPDKWPCSPTLSWYFTLESFLASHSKCQWEEELPSSGLMDFEQWTHLSQERLGQAYSPDIHDSIIRRQQILMWSKRHWQRIWKTSRVMSACMNYFLHPVQYNHSLCWARHYSIPLCHMYFQSYNPLASIKTWTSKG